MEQYKELDKAYYKLFTIETRCLRLPLSIFLDNTAIVCLDTSLNKCSLCSNKDSILTTLKDKEEARFQANNQSLIKLEEKLIEFYNNYCFNCLIDPYSTLTSYKHSLLNCVTTITSLELKAIVTQVKQIIKPLEPSLRDLVCNKCLIPNIVCIKLKDEYNITTNNCYLKDFMFYIISIFYYYRDLLDFIIEESILQQPLNLYILNILKEVTFHDIKTTLLIKIFTSIKVSTFIRQLEERTRDSSIEGDTFSQKEEQDPPITLSIERVYTKADKFATTSYEQELEELDLDLDFPNDFDSFKQDFINNIEDYNIENTIEDLSLKETFQKYKEVQNKEISRRDVIGSSSREIAPTTKDKGKKRLISRSIDITPTSKRFYQED